jgi:hypothetical protein
MKSKLLLLSAILFSLLMPACSGMQRKPGPKRYRAWCNYEQKFIGDWDEDKAKVEQQRKDHERRFGPAHVTRIQVD